MLERTRIFLVEEITYNVLASSRKWILLELENFMPGVLKNIQTPHPPNRPASVYPFGFLFLVFYICKLFVNPYKRAMRLAI
jgi:hypothetical protein